MKITTNFNAGLYTNTIKATARTKNGRYYEGWIDVPINGEGPPTDFINKFLKESVQHNIEDAMLLAITNKKFKNQNAERKHLAKIRNIMAGFQEAKDPTTNE